MKAGGYSNFKSAHPFLIIHPALTGTCRLVVRDSHFLLQRGKDRKFVKGGFVSLECNPGQKIKIYKFLGLYS